MSLITKGSHGKPRNLTSRVRRTKKDIQDQTERVGADEAWRTGGKRPLRTRWVDVNKGDEDDYLVRSRLVGKESKEKGTLEHSLAATPPLASLNARG